MDENEDVNPEETDEPEDAAPDPRPRAKTRSQAMRRWVLIGTVVVAVVILVLAEWRPGQGDNKPAPTASPAAAQAGGIQIPQASMCQVLPRSAAALASLASTPVASPAAGSGSATPSPAAFPPAGVPADAQTTQKVVLTVQVAIACHNAGDFARMFTLYSDNYVRSLLSEAAAQTQLPPEAMAILLGTPQPLPSTQWRGIQAMGEVDKLPDGRVSVFVVTVDPTRQVPTQPSLMVLVSKNGLWQIDNIFDLSSATPTP